MQRSIEISNERKKLLQLPLLDYAHKNDLQNVLEADEIIKKLELNNINRDWSLCACSALKGFGIMEGISWLLNKVSERINKL